MIGESFLADIGIRMIIWLLASVAPIAFIYHLLYVTFILLPSHYPLVLSIHFDSPPTTFMAALRCWLAIELLFFVYYFNARKRFQKPSTYIPMSPKERQRVLDAVIDELNGDVQLQRRFFEGWFYKIDGRKRIGPVKLEEIYRGNLAEWLGFALFQSDVNSIADVPALRDELYGMIDRIADRCKCEIPDGYNMNVRSYRLGLDELNAAHRPFLFYLGSWIVDGICKSILWYFGFQRYGRKPRGLLHLATSVLSPDTNSTSVTKRLQRDKDERPKVTYWYRKGDDENCRNAPIILVHGVGIGIAPYLHLLWALLSRSDWKSSMFLLELPHVAMRMHGHAPSTPRTIFEMTQALRRHEAGRPAVWIGHSLGSTIVAAACRFAPSFVHASIFVDPICFKLHHPDVISNFLYRRPSTARERFMAFFAGLELFNHKFFAREFHWFHANLLPTDVQELQRAAVFLSGKDVIVPSELVASDLQKWWGASKEQKDVSHVRNGCHWWWMDDIDHAHFLFRHGWSAAVVQCSLVMSKL